MVRPWSVVRHVVAARSGLGVDMGSWELKDLEALIRVVPDFPKPGIQFRDIGPLLRNPTAYNDLISRMVLEVRSLGATMVFGLESRGFLFAVPIARELGLGFVPVRKPGKLPGAVLEVQYALEYGSGRLQVQSDPLPPASRVVIVDDLLATGGTAIGALQLVENLGATVVGAVFAIELTALGGRSRLPLEHVKTILQL